VTDQHAVHLTSDPNRCANYITGYAGVAVTVPANAATFAPCPFTGANAFDGTAQGELIQWAIDGTHEAFLVKNGHAPQAGITPLEHYVAGTVK
jgi:hypothetical protein